MCVPQPEALALINQTRALELKKRGDESFKEGALPDAVAAYSAALEYDPENAVLSCAGPLCCGHASFAVGGG